MATQTYYKGLMPAWHEAFIVWLSADKPTPDIKKDGRRAILKAFICLLHQQALHLP